MPDTTPTKLKLHLCVIDDANGENDDYFVTASTPEGAAIAWLDHKTQDGGCTRSEVLADHEGKTLRVFQVPDVGGVTRTHDWPENVSFDMDELAKPSTTVDDADND